MAFTTANGKHVRKSTRTDDRKIAQKILDKIKGDVAENRYFEKPIGAHKTVRDMLDRYLLEYSTQHKKPMTAKRDLSLVNHLNAFFGDMTLLEVTRDLISQYKNKRRVEPFAKRPGASPTSINYEIGLLSHAFKIAKTDWGWVTANPVDNVSREKIDNLIKRWLTLEEESKLLAASPRWLAELIRFSIQTGLRRGEILALKWSQIDMGKKVFTIYEQKNQEVDTLPLNEVAMQILAERSKVRQLRGDLVFFNSAGRQHGAVNLRKSHLRAVKRSGINSLRWHDLRHTFASRLLQGGVDSFKVQKLGRWKSGAMLRRYGHFSTESLRSAIEVLAAQG